MKRPYATVAFGLAVLALVLGGCRGSGTYAPEAAVPGAGQSARTAPAQRGLDEVYARIFAKLGLPAPAASSGLPLCAAPAAALPGTYFVMAAAGVQRRGGVVLVPTHSIWIQAAFTAASPPPSPMPTPSSIPIPRIKGYLYYGTFTLTGAQQTGCAYVFVTNGRPLPGSRYNAAYAGLPNLQTPYFSLQPLAGGLVAGRLARSGSGIAAGRIALAGLNGKVVDQGTITLTGRLALP